MVNVQRVPGKGELKKYLNQGLTQKQIVEQWREDSGESVSRSAIAMAIQRYDLKSAHERPTYPDLLPWTIRTEHRDDAEARLLRHEARRRAGGKLREKDEHWLDQWLEALNTPVLPKAPLGHVVTYNREEGFRWTERKEWHTDIIDPPQEEDRAS